MPAVRTFENPDESFGSVSAEIFAKIMGHVSDVALVVGAADGVVRDVAFGASDLGDAGLGPMIGRAWHDLVTTESKGKLDALLAGASPDGRWRHLNFISSHGEDVPISFQVFGLGRGRLLGIGRDERQGAAVQRRLVDAQRELEAGHARLRQADMRFHTMLALSDLAVLTVNADTLEVLDVSAAAADRLAVNAADLVGHSFVALVDRGEVPRVRDALVRAAAGGRVGSVTARLRDGSERGFQVALFRHGSASRLLVRFEDVAGDNGAAGNTGELRALLAGLGQGVVITSGDLRILDVNRAFVDLAQLSVEENALGQPLERFVGRNGVDTGILAATLREQNGVRHFATVLVGAFGGATDVDLDAVRIGTDRKERFGFFIRTADRARQRSQLGVQDRTGLVERMTEVVGRVSLKEIVRETTDAIERLCIETALGLTDNNRAAASEMLGISRQGLYVKLARYGIGDPESSQPAS